MSDVCDEMPLFIGLVRTRIELHDDAGRYALGVGRRSFSDGRMEMPSWGFQRSRESIRTQDGRFARDAPVVTRNTERPCNRPRVLLLFATCPEPPVGWPQPLNLFREIPMLKLSPTTAASRAGSGLPLPAGPLAGFVAALFAVVLIAFFSYRPLQANTDAADRVTHTLEVMAQLEGLLSSVQDAETGQRGYPLTGAEHYHTPYNNASSRIRGAIARLKAMTVDNPKQQQAGDLLALQVQDKMEELRQTIELRRSGQAAQALQLVQSDRGKIAMERIRTVIGSMTAEERGLLDARQKVCSDASLFASFVAWTGSGVLLLLMGAAIVMTSRDYRARATLVGLRSGQMDLAALIQGEQRLDAVGDKVLGFLADYLGAQVGAVYVAEAGARFRRVAGRAVDPAVSEATEIKLGDGLLGRVAKENRLLHVQDLPANYLPVASSLGRGQPAELLCWHRRQPMVSCMR
jgi:CHASE3 domain sensor protein